MSDVRTAICVLALLLQACASSPGNRGQAEPGQAEPDTAGAPVKARASGAAGESRLVRFDVDGNVPILEGREDADAVLASGVNLGIDDELLRYRASYRLEAGDLFSFDQPDYTGTKPPSTLAGQSFGQNIVLRLPELAGAPLSLGVTAEVQGQWLFAGARRSQQERANLEWSPGPATINMQWSGNASGFDPLLALRCNFESTLKLPMQDGGRRTQALRVSGRECIVADGTRYAGTPARAWMLGYVWSGAAQESEARLRVIDPVRTGELFDMDIDPGYQLGLSHRRDFGALSAEALVSVRQAPALPTDPVAAVEDTRWSANASLTWNLADASISAHWAQGVNPLWFAPDVLEQRDRFGLALDLSSWVESLAPGTSPELGLRWDWSRLRMPGDAAVDENALRLDVALPF